VGPALVASAILIGASPSDWQARGQPGRNGRGAVLAKLELVKQFDENGDDWLNTLERHAALEYLTANPNFSDRPAPRRAV
jgi:hypothetical protein